MPSVLDDKVTIELELDEDIAAYLKEMADEDGKVVIPMPIGENGKYEDVEMWLEDK